MISFLQKLSTRYAKWTVLVFVILTAISLALSFQKIRLDTNQDSLMSKDQPYLKKHIQFLKDFGDWESIYLIVHTNDSKVEHKQQLIKDYAFDLEKRLKKQKDLFESFQFRTNSNYLYSQLLLLSSDSEFQNFLEWAQKNKSILGEFLHIKTFNDYKSFLASLLQQASTQSQLATNPKIAAFFEKLFQLPYDDQVQSELIHTDPLFQWNTDLPYDRDGYFWTPDRQALILQVMPQKDFEQMTVVEKPIQFLQTQVKELKKKYPQIKVGITGRPVLQYDEARVTGVDSEKAGLASFILVALLYFIVFRRFKRPLFALLSLFCGLALTLGLVSLITPTLNLLSIVFAAILIGLGVDYGVHILYERFQTAKISEVIQRKAAPIFLGAVTSALAFGTAWFTDFWGLQQLGLIAALGLLICCLAQIILLPSLLYLFDQKDSAKHQPLIIARHLNLNSIKTILILAVLTGLAALLIPRVDFEKNILNLQNQNLESIQYEKRLQEDWNIPTWFVVEVFDNLQDLQIKQNQVTKLKSVLKTQSLLDLLPKNSESRIKDLQSLFQSLPLHSKRNSLANEINTLRNKAFQNGKLEEYEDLEKLQALYSKTPDLDLEERALKIIKLWQWQIKSLLDPSPQKTVPTNLKAHLVSAQNQYALLIFPKKQIWIPENMEEFLSDVRSVLPQVTGTPVTTYESYSLMISGFQKVALLTILLVFVITLIHFKDFKRPLLILLNLAVSLVWLLAVMGAFGLTINLANFFAFPILLGTGMDHGIHILHHNKKLTLADSSYQAILLSSMTTILGFGSLAFVRHPGLSSFGILLSVGSFFVLVSSTLILPQFLKYEKKS